MKKNSSEIILVAICGKGASGKDTLSEKLYLDLKNNGINVHKILRTTTRPQRPSEFKNPPYRFVTDSAFSIEKRRGWFIEDSSYRGWRYGTQISELNNGINIGSFDIKALKKLKDSNLIDELIVVYLQEPLKTRVKRYRDRAGHFSLEMYRRVLSDAISHSFLDLKLEGFNCIKLRPGRGILSKSKTVQRFLEDNLII